MRKAGPHADKARHGAYTYHNNSCADNSGAVPCQRQKLRERRLVALRVGHRGAAGHVTGNTLASIAKALALGVDFVEIDVRATRDGHPVVFHDRRVDGTTDGSGAVIELTLEEMSRLRTADGQPIPTLDEALAAINNRVGVMLDIKSPGIVERVWTSVTGNKFVRPVIYASFLHAELLAVKRLVS